MKTKGLEVAVNGMAVGIMFGHKYEGHKVYAELRMRTLGSNTNEMVLNQQAFDTHAQADAWLNALMAPVALTAHAVLVESN